MKLGELFAADSGAALLTSDKVKFFVMSPKRNGPPREAEAVFALVDEVEERTSARDAEREVLAEYKDEQGGPIPVLQQARLSAQLYHLLWRVLRDKDTPEEKFGETVLQLRKCVPWSVANRLLGQYNRWVEKELPVTPSMEQQGEVEEAAEGKS